MATTDFSPPAQIDTATVSLRRWTESDADGLRRVVTESFDTHRSVVRLSTSTGVQV